MTTYDSDEINNGKLRYLRPFIVLVPCLIVCLIDIKYNVPLLESMVRLLITIGVFFVFGTIAQNVIRKYMLEVVKAEQEDSETNDDEQDNQEENTEQGEELEKDAEE